MADDAASVLARLPFVEAINDNLFSGKWIANQNVWKC